MKKIRINKVLPKDKTSNITERKKCYIIHLGEGKFMRYTTRKDYKYALAEINRQFNAILFELNDIWIYTFGEYRKIWFYLKEEGMDDRTIKEINADLSRTFTILIERSDFANGNEFSFRRLNQIIEYLAKNIQVLAEIRRNKKQYIEYHSLMVKNKYLGSLGDWLMNIDINPKYCSDSRRNFNSHFLP